VRGVHVKQSDRCSSARREADDFSIFHFEMVSPPILSGIEKQHDLLRVGIDAAEIRPLVGIAAIACQSELGRIVTRLDVLPCDDVLDVECEVRGGLLRD